MRIRTSGPFSSMKFREQMSTVLQTVQESFAFVGTAQVAAEIEHSIVILQGQGVQKSLQFLETVTNLRRIAFVGLSIGLVKLIQNCLAVTIPGIKRILLDIHIQAAGNVFYGATSCARRTPRRIPSMNPAFS